jgi:hypothetical protein
MAWVENNQADILKAFSVGNELMVIDNVVNHAVWTDNPEYVGCALQGTLNSEPRWRIKKLLWSETGHYAGSRLTKPNQVWDNRESLTYT